MNSQKLNFLIITIFFQLPILPKEMAIFKSQKIIDGALNYGYEEISYDHLRDSFVGDLSNYPERAAYIKSILEDGKTKFSERSAQRPFYTKIACGSLSNIWDLALLSSFVGVTVGCVSLAPRVIFDIKENFDVCLNLARKSFAASGAGIVTMIASSYAEEQLYIKRRPFDVAQSNSETIGQVIQSVYPTSHVE